MNASQMCICSAGLVIARLLMKTCTLPDWITSNFRRRRSVKPNDWPKRSRRCVAKVGGGGRGALFWTYFSLACRVPQFHLNDYFQLHWCATAPDLDRRGYQPDGKGFEGDHGNAHSIQNNKCNKCIPCFLRYLKVGDPSREGLGGWVGLCLTSLPFPRVRQTEWVPQRGKSPQFSAR